jgi:plastocyanin
MKLLRPMLSLLIAAIPLLASDVVGHAIITKRLTKKALSPVVYNLRGTAPPTAAASESVNEFDRMVVMLEGGSLPPRPPVTAVLNQRNGRFDPEIVIVPVGSAVEFPNFDPVFHNVFSLSKAQPFDLGFYPKGQSRTVKFTHPGIVQVYCHIHANMYAAIVATSSAWYGKPSADGGFSWSDVPAGHYRLNAWHKIAGLYKTEVDVPENGKVEVTIQVPVDVEPRP